MPTCNNPESSETVGFEAARHLAQRGAGQVVHPDPVERIRWVVAKDKETVSIGCHSSATLNTERASVNLAAPRKGVAGVAGALVQLIGSGINVKCLAALAGLTLGADHHRVEEVQIVGQSHHGQAGECGASREHVAGLESPELGQTERRSARAAAEELNVRSGRAIGRLDHERDKEILRVDHCRLAGHGRPGKGEGEKDQGADARPNRQMTLHFEFLLVVLGRALSSPSEWETAKRTLYIPQNAHNVNRLY